MLQIPLKRCRLANQHARVSNVDLAKIIKVPVLFIALSIPTPPSAAQPHDSYNENLLIEYGRDLREIYRTGDVSRTKTERFMSLEREIIERGIINNMQANQIERGLLYVGMPVEQAIASRDDLQEVDSLTVNTTTIRTFRSPPTNFSLRNRDRRTDTIISCNDRVVTIYATSGLVTADTYDFGRYTVGGRKYQTNFRSGFWGRENRAARRRGGLVASEPSVFIDRHGPHWVLFLTNRGDFTKPSIWWRTGHAEVSERGYSSQHHQRMRLGLENGNLPSC